MDRVAATEAVCADTALTVCCITLLASDAQGFAWYNVLEQHGESAGQLLPSPQVGPAAATTVASSAATAAVRKRVIFEE